MMNTKKEWDKIYSSGKQINDYPYDFVVSATKKYIKKQAYIIFALEKEIEELKNKIIIIEKK